MERSSVRLDLLKLVYPSTISQGMDEVIARVNKLEETIFPPDAKEVRAVLKGERKKKADNDIFA